MAADKETALAFGWAEGIKEEIAQDVVEGVIGHSQNTRLAVKRGVPVKAPAITTLSATGNTGPCGGVIRGPKNVCAIPFQPGNALASLRWTGETLERLESLDSLGTDSKQSAYFPYPLVSSKELPNSGSATQDSVLTSDGRTWCVSLVSGALFMQVFDVDGQVEISHRIFALPSATPIAPVTITAHNRVGLGDYVMVWYISTGTVRAVMVSLSSGALVVGTVNSVATYNTSFEFAVCSQPTSEYAYLLYRSSSVNATLAKIDTSVPSTSATNVLANVYSAAGTKTVAVSTYSIGGTTYVDAIANDDGVGGGFTFVRHINAATMATIWTDSASITPLEGRVAIQPFVANGSSYVVAAQTPSFVAGGLGTALGTAPGTITTFYFFDMATGALSPSSPTLEWYMLHCPGTYQKVSDSEIYPFFPCIVELGEALVADPSIEIFTPLSAFVVSPVMRCGVDRVSDPRSVYTWTAQFSGNNISVLGTRMIFSYQILRGGGIMAYGKRLLEFDLAPATQPSIAYDEADVATVSASLVASWDGLDLAEIAPLHRPAVNIMATGGSGSAITDTLSVVAVVSWYDAAGLLHRSAPSIPVTLTLAGTSPIIYVAVPPGTRKSFYKTLPFKVSVYAKFSADPLFTLRSWTADTALTNGCHRYMTISTSGDVGPALYSTGEGGTPLTPVAPPPTRACATVGARMWLIDAEDPYRLLPSKPKERGIAFEFAAENEIYLPATHGEAVDIVDGGGVPLVLCERGVFSIGGYGQDYLGNGSFTEPKLEFTRGAKPGTVVQIPGKGILFQSTDGRFIMLGQDTATYAPLAPREVTRPIVFLTESEVAYPIAGGLGFLVYNWEADGWTTWTENIGGDSPTSFASFIDAEGNTTCLLYAGDNGTFATLDSSSYSEAAMVLQRGWIAPEATQGDVVFRELWLQGLYAGGHGVQVEVYFDWNETTSISGSWTGDELSAEVISGRYTLCLNLHATQARSIRVVLTETSTTGNAMQPVNMFVYYGACQGVRRRTLTGNRLQ